MLISTASYYDLKINILANTAKSPNNGAKPIRVTVCNNVINKVTSAPTPTLAHVYVLNSHLGEKVSDDVSTWFKDIGANCDLDSTPYTLTNDDGTSYTDGVVSIDGTHKLKIKTNAKYATKDIRVYITTATFAIK